LNWFHLFSDNIIEIYNQYCLFLDRFHREKCVIINRSSPHVHIRLLHNLLLLPTGVQEKYRWPLTFACHEKTVTIITCYSFIGVIDENSNNMKSIWWYSPFLLLSSNPFFFLKYSYIRNKPIHFISLNFLSFFLSHTFFFI